MTSQYVHGLSCGKRPLDKEFLQNLFDFSDSFLNCSAARIVGIRELFSCSPEREIKGMEKTITESGNLSV